ncbi:hypothetical protein EVAR_79110_1 [Eumeta japonica]|uniref:Uncharacterized protein n=1 Tax=Eumeta variegata TaxID=151549 RepID=A0A4C1X3P6_EUMVA|nr:hypothetical protein EVAR_79110_1 [Eumeta japonica]
MSTVVDVVITLTSTALGSPRVRTAPAWTAQNESPHTDIKSLWENALAMGQYMINVFDVTTSNNSIFRAACTKKLTSLSRYARCPVPQARLEWSAQFVSCCIYLPYSISIAQKIHVNCFRQMFIK